MQFFGIRHDRDRIEVFRVRKQDNVVLEQLESSKDGRERKEGQDCYSDGEEIEG